MNIVFFSNPDFFGDQERPLFSSMPQFTKMLVDGMIARGHQVKVWTPKTKYYNLPITGSFKKWMGYIDQYLVFPSEVRLLLKECPADTLFVFTDQAQGPWVPLVANRHHIVHCHDFMALSSAMGQVPENKTSWTGKQYQKIIRRGYSRGQHFISVSKNTAADLARALPAPPLSSNIVYNGLNKKFDQYELCNARLLFGQRIGADFSNGYLLNVGGNQWYKNRLGVVEIYNAWRRIYKCSKPLVLVGESPCTALATKIQESPFKNDIIVCSNLNNAELGIAYSGATLFLFPSLAEGFGWPIAEAMSAGCPVVTTNEAPMTEVAGKAATFIPRRPVEKSLATVWASRAALAINRIVILSNKERELLIAASINNSKRFDPISALDSIEAIYEKVRRS